MKRFLGRILSFFKQGWRFVQDVRIEALQVSWPSFREVVQTTFFIAIIVLIAGLFLWGIDSLILYAIKWLASQKG